MRLTTHPHLVPMLRMNVALPLPLLYAFMMCRGTILPLLLLYITRDNNNSKSFCSVVVLDAMDAFKVLLNDTLSTAVQLIQ